VFLCSSQFHQTGKTLRPPPHLRIRAGAFRHPTGGFSLRQRAILKSDSQVIAGHIDKCSKARDPKLEKYLDIVRRMEASFKGFSVKNISRGENEHADLLAKSVALGSHYLWKYFLKQ
jgi:hypothetical protein